jgi:hypothetical protein
VEDDAVVVAVLRQVDEVVDGDGRGGRVELDDDVPTGGLERGDVGGVGVDGQLERLVVGGGGDRRDVVGGRSARADRLLLLGSSVGSPPGRGRSALGRGSVDRRRRGAAGSRDRLSRAPPISENAINTTIASTMMRLRRSRRS